MYLCMFVWGNGELWKRRWERRNNKRCTFERNDVYFYQVFPLIIMLGFDLLLHKLNSAPPQQKRYNQIKEQFESYGLCKICITGMLLEIFQSGVTRLPRCRQIDCSGDQQSILPAFLQKKINLVSLSTRHLELVPIAHWNQN